MVSMALFTIEKYYKIWHTEAREEFAGLNQGRVALLQPIQYNM